MNEIWKDIEGYEGLYQVSSKGRVKSFMTHPIRKNNPPRILQLFKTKGGYLCVKLCRNKRKKTTPVHRLVAQTFIPNPNHFRHINHKDENITNNCVENLEWCTQQYNNLYGTRNLRSSITKRKNNGTYNRLIVQMTLDWKEIARYDTLRHAQKATGTPQGSIWKVCKGKLITSHGYRWAFVNIDSGE